MANRSYMTVGSKGRVAFDALDGGSDSRIFCTGDYHVPFLWLPLFAVENVVRQQDADGETFLFLSASTDEAGSRLEGRIPRLASVIEGLEGIAEPWLKIVKSLPVGEVRVYLDEILAMIPAASGDSPLMNSLDFFLHPSRSRLEQVRELTNVHLVTDNAARMLSEPSPESFINVTVEEFMIGFPW